MYMHFTYYALISIFTVIPTRPENFKYIDVNCSINSLWPSVANTTHMVFCSAKKLIWDPPSNYNETIIDHYELTVGIQRVNVTNTEWIFIPSDDEMTFSEYAMPMEINASVLAVDICGQIGIATAIIIIKPFCSSRVHDPDIYKTSTQAGVVTVAVVMVVSMTIFIIITMFILLINMHMYRYRSRHHPTKLYAVRLTGSTNQASETQSIIQESSV